MNSENIFFDVTKLKKCGNNVIIGKTVRIRYPELVEIGDDVIIDDFTYISTQLTLSSNTHISSGCKLIGGRDSSIVFEEFSTLSPGVVLVAGSDNYESGIATPVVPMKFKGNCVIGKIVLNKHCIVGSNSVVLPNVTFNQGAVLGALSLAKLDLNEYSIYAGVPCKFIKYRNKQEILEFQKKYKEWKG